MVAERELNKNKVGGRRLCKGRHRPGLGPLKRPGAYVTQDPSFLTSSFNPATTPDHSQNPFSGLTCPCFGRWLRGTCNQHLPDMFCYVVCQTPEGADERQRYENLNTTSTVGIISYVSLS